MSKTQKGTRISGLPARVLLSLRQDATGSYPVNRRTASDNRTGKYSAFFPDTKTIVFNQQVSGTGLQPLPVDTSAYVENIFEISSPTISQAIPFDYTFTGTPVVIIEKLTSTNNSDGVNPFIEAITTTTFTVGFSAPFAGTVKFRAITLSSGPQFVQRTPLYSGSYTRVVASTGSIKDGGNTAYLNQFNLLDEPLDLKKVFITFFDKFTTYEANMSASIGMQTSTYLAITSSANVASQITAQFLGYADSDASVGVSGIVYPLGLTSASINSGLSEENRKGLFRQPFLSDGEVKNIPISAPGKQLKGIADSFITFTPGQDLQPFMDSGNPAVDGKLSSSISGVNAFYATGSAVEVTGPGFQQPLWSKSKIEIDITPSATQTFTLYKSASVGSYPMGYWNPNTRLYEGIGTGKGIDSYSGDLNGLKQSLEEQTFGFHSSIDFGGYLLGLPETYNLYGRQISNYGFPYHPKFQATGSQLLAMKDHISEPFLLEKICIEISSSMNIPSKSATSPAGWTFFLLNQRPSLLGKDTNSQTIQYQFGGSGAPSVFLTSSLLISTTSEVVDIIQMFLSSSLDSFDYLNRELHIKSLASSQNAQWVMNSTVKSSIGYEEGIGYIFSGALAGGRNTMPTLQYSGRNQIDQVFGRDWINAVEQPSIAATGSYYINSYNNPISISSQYTKPNPYILLPSDKLTFGFQLPWDNDNGIAQNSLTFATTGINKITLYGSSLRVNPETNQVEEYHDTLNQLLSSNSIHEIIGEP